MTRYDFQRVGYVLADLEALRDFNPLLEPHKPKLDRAIERLQQMVKEKGKSSRVIK